MARRTRVCVLVLVLLVAAFPLVGVAGASLGEELDQECSYPVSVTDGTDTEVTLEERPDEIVVMHASSAQITHEIGVWERVVGAPVTPFTAYLEDHDAPRDVTDDEGFPVVEEIVNLDPDLVIAGHVADPETVETLRSEGLTVYTTPPPTTVADIATNVRTIGLLVGECEGAEETVGWMEERLDRADELAGDESPLVYYELGDGWTTGAGTFQHDVIQRAGGENLGAADGGSGWYQISEETVVDMDPDWIVYGDVAAEPPVTEAVRSTTAIEQNQTIAVDSNYINQAGPRVVLVVETIAEEMHEGEAGDDAAEDSAEALPGFGALAGAIALLLGAFLARRR